MPPHGEKQRKLARKENKRTERTRRADVRDPQNHLAGCGW